MDAAFLVVGFLDGEYTGFLAKCTGFLGKHTGFLARRVKAPSLVMPWFNRPFVAREAPILHVIGITVDDKLPDKDILLTI